METTASKQQVDRLSQTAHDTVDRAAQTVSSVADRMSEKYEELYAMQEDWVQAGREYVRELNRLRSERRHVSRCFMAGFSRGFRMLSMADPSPVVGEGAGR